MQTDTTSTTQTASTGKPVVEYLSSGIHILRLGAPGERVITLTLERLEALNEAIAKLRQERPRGIIIMGSSADMFTTGADINLISAIKDAALAEKLARQGQQIFDAVASLPFPTVAAISGPCVGGGCELVLACTYRLITDEKSSIIGLPEIKIGILPGFGGTQRLPRLIGLPKALDIILAGKTIRPKQALACGLVNEIVPFATLKERAEGILIGTSKTREIKLKLVDKILTHTAVGRNFVAKKARETIRRETKGFYPAPPAALESALYGLANGMENGLLNEAKELGRLIVTPESKSLVRLFFLTEASKSLGKPAKKSVEHVHAIVIGAGVMGAGIAHILARSEASVILKDTVEEAVKKGMDHIRTGLSKAKHLSETERSFILNRIEATTKDSPNIGNANIAIEAIVENLDVKKKVLGALSKQMPPDAIISSNTSSLSITEIAKGIDNPERVVGMHFFNPVEKMPLVEIIRGDKTSDKTIAIVAALTTKLGKFPIVVKDVPGFLVNRILSPYLNEAAYLLAEGYSIKEIDDAALKFGMPMGPVRLLDEVGLDVAAHVADIMLAGYGERMRAPEFAKDLASKGKKGKKSGAGFYIFDEKGKGTPDPEIKNLLKISATPKRPGDREYIIQRLILSMVNEAVKCLDEGVAGKPGPDAANQVDLGTVMGTGFPPFRGGILHYANSVGARTIYTTLKGFESEFGARYAVAPGIQKRAENGKGFNEA